MIRKTKYGFYVIDQDSHLGKWAEDEGCLAHDKSLLHVILPLVPFGGTVLEAGCYIGDHLIAYLDAVGVHGTVYGIEPNPEAVEACKLNCPQAIVLHAALGDRLAKVKLMPPTDSNIGTMRVVPSDTGDVSMMTLDSIGLPRLDFMCLDCEGMELAVLTGALRTIHRCRPKMLVEMNASTLAANGTTQSELMHFIAELGYRIQNVYEKEPMSGPQWDALCLPI